MMPPNLRKRFFLYSKLSVHKRKVEQAQEIVGRWLRFVSKPYCAWSTGKDSTCILHLVREQDPDIFAVCFDGGAFFPESESLIAETSKVIVFPTDEPLIETLKGKGLDGAEDLDRATMQVMVYGPIKRLLAEFNFDGVALGLRKYENRGRLMSRTSHGHIYRYKRDGLWRCAPIFDWTYNDVWAFIVAQDIPYCGVYDKMWGMPEEDQRLSYWTGETKRRWGRFAWLKKNYPDLYRQFVAELPEVSCYT